MEEEKKEKKTYVSDSLEDLLSDDKISKEKEKSIISDQDNKEKSSKFPDRDQKDITLERSLDDLIKKDPLIQSSRENPKSFKILTENSDNRGFEIECPPAIDAIPWTEKAFSDVILMAKAINEISIEKFGHDSKKLEVYCYVLTDFNRLTPKTPARITEIYIPFHSLSETSVKVSEEGVLEVQQYIKENNKILLGWAHSHGHFKVYSSKTDEINHETLLNDTSNIIKIKNFNLKYVYGITINANSEKYGVIITQYPCGNKIHRVDQNFDIQGEEYSTAQKLQRYAEIKKLLESRTVITPPTPNKSLEDTIADLRDELEIEFTRKLRKSKNLLIDELPEDDIGENFHQIQTILQRYDMLILDSTEETFNSISEKLLKSINKFSDDI
ncbi:hypothetical protein DSAG12_01464 [Promethearchaeum syntrophicum]|uniref:MPN domain-containing protein n=1 Tax=Promethearchaeum syntrophicum TaxID=2594042 RepID=A0A5B9D8P9_9ARCH|nr:hypothetical protein [Candidatus Prometheoarchaeum syntrophicum]QEE15638.1 hypothetical protein DSAG12_01464 [Candidatus Prometheoarchaeum syntrophicum]